MHGIVLVVVMLSAWFTDSIQVYAVFGAFLAVHGFLHLMGYDHETDTGEMRQTETRWRKRLGLPTGLIERTETANRSKKK